MKIGITTTLPIEVIYAAGHTVVDLNNIFISSQARDTCIAMAEQAGYPRNICSWIKGIYGVILKERDIKKVVAVTQGDCSNTHALMETLELEDIEIIPFAFPYKRDREFLKSEIDRLISYFQTTWQKVSEVKQYFDHLRSKVKLIDRWTWEKKLVSGWENHYYQISCSDFKSNPEQFEKEIDDFIATLSEREEIKSSKIIGYIGIPPIYDDFYQNVEKLGASVVFNEIQRQFTMPYHCADLVDQYLNYTYPYRVFHRIDDIKAEVEKRKLKGLVHYVQSFCFRQIEDLIFRKKLKVPFLTLEGEKPSPLDARSLLRLEAFLEMIN